MAGCPPPTVSHRNKETLDAWDFQEGLRSAFNLDYKDHAAQAFEPRVAANEAAAIEEAEELARQHAGVIVWRRDSNPVVGEEGEPEVVYSIVRIGDFD